MSYNGSGAFTPPGASFPAVGGTVIESAKYNAVINDIATGLSTAITKDGQTTVTANIPLNGYKLTGVGPGTDRTDTATLANIQDSAGTYIATVSGTDTITLTPSPAITAYIVGQEFCFIAVGANTTAVLVILSGLGAKALTKAGSTALIAGDIPSGSMVHMTYDGTRFILSSAAEYATLTGAQTLTNKTLTSPTVTGPTVTGATNTTLKKLTDNIVCLSNYADFATAISSIGATVTTLLVNTSASVTDNVTVPSTLTLVLWGQGAFSVSTTKTLTINGNFIADKRTVFAGAGVVSFATNKVMHEFYPEWWGAVGDGSTNDGGAFALMFTAIPEGAKVQLSTAVYALSTAQTITKMIIMEGTNMRATHLYWTGGASAAFTLSSAVDNVTFRNLRLGNNGTATLAVEIAATQRILMENIFISPAVKFATAAFRTAATPSNNIIFRNVEIYATEAGQETPIGIHVREGNQVTFDNVKTSGLLTGAKIGTGGGNPVQNFRCTGSKFEAFSGVGANNPGSTTAVGLALDNVQAFSVDGSNSFEMDADQNATATGQRAITITTAGSGWIGSNFFTGNGFLNYAIEFLSGTALDIDIAGNNFYRMNTVGVKLHSTARNIRIGANNVASPTTRATDFKQTITAVGNTILPVSREVDLDADNNYTLTSAPTIPDGEDGQILILTNIDTTDTITIQDQGTLASSNLRLSATTIALGPRDSIELRYSSVVGDWVQIGQTNVL